MLFIFAAAFWTMARKQIPQKRWLLWLALWGIPLPWIASECGWFVAEYGRQPWTIAEVLPTFLSASTVPASHVVGSLLSLGLLYTAMLVVEVWLMLKYVRLGPSSLQTGRYHFEQPVSPAVA
jgi:cytochrome d ubiquinol oxidase subunit I